MIKRKVKYKRIESDSFFFLQKEHYKPFAGNWGCTSSLSPVGLWIIRIIFITLLCLWTVYLYSNEFSTSNDLLKWKNTQPLLQSNDYQNPTTSPGYIISGLHTLLNFISIISFIPPNSLILEMRKMRISRLKKKNLSRHAAGEWQYLDSIT